MSVQLSDMFNAVLAARQRLAGVVLQTPMLNDEALGRDLAAETWFKAENLQRAGSFKLRGAYNKIAQLSSAEKARGVVAPSAGNHAQGVALAAQLHGVRATIVMPSFAPLTKVVATRAFGAEVVLYGQSFDDAAAHAEALAAEHGYTRVHAFDDLEVIAGQGTIGLEMLEQCPQMTLLVVPIGGGGLIAGIATVIKTQKPSVRIIGVQAAGCSAVKSSLAAGTPQTVAVAQTIADGIAVKRPGALTLPMIEALVDDVVEVSDDDIARGIAHCAQRSRLVVEGAGAAGVGALIAGAVKPSSTDIVATVLCGGNIDGNLLARVIEQVMVRQGRYMLLRLAVVDRPGTLAPLIDCLAAVGANIMDIFHRRAVWLAPLGKVGVELVLEVRDESHGQEVMAHLEQHGYHAEREGQGDWPV
jgi:threonine dehydratase